MSTAQPLQPPRGPTLPDSSLYGASLSAGPLLRQQLCPWPEPRDGTTSARRPNRREARSR